MGVMRSHALRPEPCVVRVRGIEHTTPGLTSAGQPVMVAVSAVDEQDGHSLTWVIPAADAPIVGTRLRLTIEVLPSDDPHALARKRIEADLRGTAGP